MGLLKAGLSFVLIPGGASEATFATPEEDICVLDGRTGFIRLAIEHGTDILPIFNFGEAALWDMHKPAEGSFLHRFCIFMQLTTGMACPLLKNILPRRIPIKTVVGRPLRIEQCSNPSDEMVEATLEKYKQALLELYEAHRPNPEKKLRFVRNPLHELSNRNQAKCKKH